MALRRITVSSLRLLTVPLLLFVLGNPILAECGSNSGGGNNGGGGSSSGRDCPENPMPGSDCAGGDGGGNSDPAPAECAPDTTILRPQDAKVIDTKVCPGWFGVKTYYAKLKPAGAEAKWIVDVSQGNCKVGDWWRITECDNSGGK